MKTLNYTQEARDARRKLKQLRDAAPDLLEALQRISILSARRMAEGGDKMDYQDANRNAGDIARAAVDRATR